MPLVNSSDNAGVDEVDAPSVNNHTEAISADIPQLSASGNIRFLAKPQAYSDSSTCRTSSSSSDEQLSEGGMRCSPMTSRRPHRSLSPSSKIKEAASTLTNETKESRHSNRKVPRPQRSLSPSTKLKSMMMRETKEPRPSNRKVPRPQRSLSPNTKLKSKLTKETKEPRPSNRKISSQHTLSPSTKLKSKLTKETKEPRPLNRKIPSQHNLSPSTKLKSMMTKESKEPHPANQHVSRQRSLSPNTKLQSMIKESKEPRPSNRKIARPKGSLSPSTKLKSMMTKETKEPRPSNRKMSRQRSLSPNTKLASMMMKETSSSDRSSRQRRSIESMHKMYSDLGEKYSSGRPGEVRRERESVSPTPSLSSPVKNNHSDGAGLGEQTKSLSPSNSLCTRHSDTSERPERKPLARKIRSDPLSQSEHSRRSLRRSDLYSCKRSGKNELDTSQRSRSKPKSMSYQNEDISSSDHHRSDHPREMRRGQRGVTRSTSFRSTRSSQSRQSEPASNLKGDLDVLRAEVQVREQREEDLQNEIDLLRQELAEKEKSKLLSPEKALKGGSSPVKETSDVSIINKVKKISGGGINQVKKVTKMLPFGRKKKEQDSSL
jgi:hypothetical protein